MGILWKAILFDSPLVFLFSLLLIDVQMNKPVGDIVGRNSSKHVFWISLKMDTYAAHRNRCETFGGHLFDLRGPYTSSLLNQLSTYYDHRYRKVMKQNRRYWMGLTRIVFNVSTATDFTWFDGELENGDILAKYRFNRRENGSILDECTAVKYVIRDHIFTIESAVCDEKLGLICQKETEEPCLFFKHHKTFMNTTLELAPDVTARRECIKTCKTPPQSNCWYFVYNKSAESCQMFLSDAMPRADRFCDWLDDSTDSDTFRRDCIDLMVYDAEGNQITYPICPGKRSQPRTVLSPAVTTTLDLRFDATSVKSTTNKAVEMSYVNTVEPVSVPMDTSGTEKSTLGSTNVMMISYNSLPTPTGTGMTEQVSATNPVTDIHTVSPTTADDLERATVFTTTKDAESVSSSTKFFSTTPTVSPSTGNTGNSSSPGTSTERLPQKVVCRQTCHCPRSTDDLEINIENILEKLTLTKSALSAHRRRYRSEPDDRMSAVCLGYLGGTILVFVALSIVALDAEYIVRALLRLFK